MRWQQRVERRCPAPAPAFTHEGQACRRGQQPRHEAAFYARLRGLCAALVIVAFNLTMTGCLESGSLEGADAADSGVDQGAEVLDDKALTARDITGSYQRKPVENGWHQVQITLENGRLWWKNQAGSRWSLTYQNGVLKTGTDCPYGVKTVTIRQTGGVLSSLSFLGDTYQKTIPVVDELAAFAGSYERRPVENGWHQVQVKRETSGLWWTNAAGSRWSLSYANGVLKTGTDCPYGVQTLSVKKGADGMIASLGFAAETYTKLGGGVVPEGPRTCAQGCSAPTPICGPDSKCTSARWVEPISTLPDKWKAKIDTQKWTKWVRSVIPVVGQALTQDAALLEVAYFAEKVHMPRGQVLVPDLVNSMLGANPSRFSVYPACPNAWMHPAVQPTQSSGGGGRDDTLVTEDWVLRYPKCTGQNAVACNLMKPGTLCNNCGWSSSDPNTCRDTLAHEHGHTIDGHRKYFLDSSMFAVDQQVFPYNPEEGPAWSAASYFMNPSLESNTGRDRGVIMRAEERNYWSVTQKFTMSEYPAGSGYTLKTTRCPQMGLTQPCPDTLTRTYAVPLDNVR